MNRTLEKIDPVGQWVVAVQQWPQEVHKSSTTLLLVQSVYKENGL